MEKIVDLERKETHFNLKYSIEHARLFHVSLLHAKVG